MRKATLTVFLGLVGAADTVQVHPVLSLSLAHGGPDQPPDALAAVAQCMRDEYSSIIAPRIAAVLAQESRSGVTSCVSCGQSADALLALHNAMLLRPKPSQVSPNSQFAILAYGTKMCRRAECLLGAGRIIYNARRAHERETRSLSLLADGSIAPVKIDRCLACHQISSPADRKGYQVCSGCKIAHYCSIACQRADWGVHKTVCRPAPPTE